MKKKVIRIAGLLLLMIGMVSVSGYYFAIKDNGDGVGGNVGNGSEQPDSDEHIVEGTKTADENESYFKYDILQDDTVVITNYLGDETFVFVPERLDGKAVSVIGEGAFLGNDSIEQVLLPQGIEVIEGQAFQDCPSLQYVVMGTGLKRIGQDAFSNCSSLKELRLPEGMTRIDSCICAYCSELEKVVVPQSMEEISSSAFMECNKLYLIFGSNSCAENFAQRKGLVYVNLERIREEGGLVW